MSMVTVSPPVTAWPDAALPPVDPVFVGREPLATELLKELEHGPARAILLSGLGGVGKTRLALEVARRVAPAFDGRVAWIPLTHAVREGGLAPAIAAVLGLGEGRRDHLAEALSQAIRDAPTLLVLDSAETALHDLGLVDELLRLAPPLRILVTSRIAADRSGMDTRVVEALDVPAETDDAETVAASPAVELLVERAARAGVEIAVTDRTAPAIARLVGHLDGLPLALELAAPLLKSLPPHRLVSRIGDRLDPVLATIEWSHDQLDTDDRRLYRRLAVFGVPFRARHVRTFGERALAHGLSPFEPDIAAGLERLAAAGLVRARPDELGVEPATGPDDPRGSGVREYELPALIREDALRRLEASGEATAALWARANDLLALCEVSHDQLEVSSRRDLLDQLDIVHDDLVAVLDRARAAGQGAFMLRMAGALAEYWRARGRLAEGRLWLDTALRVGAPDRTAERARALHGAGMLANWQSDFGRARAELEEALAIRLELGREADAAATLNQLGLIGLVTGELAVAEEWCRRGLEIRRSLGDESAVAASLNTLGGILQFGGRWEEAREMFEESLAIRRGLGDEAGSSVSLANLALVARDARDLGGAEAMLREAKATRERLGDRQRVAVVRHNLALVLFDGGDLDGARAELEAAIETSRELGDRLELSNALSDLGFVEANAGRLDRAAELQADALAVAARIGAKGIVAQAIDGAAGIVWFGGDPRSAALLWAAAERIRRDSRYKMLVADRRRVEAEIDAARAALDEATWREAWTEGSDLTFDAAVDRAREAIGARPAATDHPARAAGQVAV
ncbi:MAG TPA: tetratricopeptide repeat protein [Candidatus Limnocylindrales bacterium]|nr:tetratricopeptide repeat protein [Candidatus Limnocylindrales bacterium]